MSITINGEERRIGLALSGGGFRATAFHLGVFRKLAELDLLWELDLLSCVSGGSIAGGFLAANWMRPDALDRLEHYLRTRSIAVSSVLGGLLHPHKSRTDKLADSYDEDLFHGATLGDLSGPRLYVNATDLATGNAFFFVAGGGEPALIGEHELGMVDAPGFPLSRAVAASSAFPPVFPPVRLNPDTYPVPGGPAYVTLTDGGVYDNLGVNPTVRSRNALDYVIVSDGGKPFALDREPVRSGTMVLYKALGILMENVRGLQLKKLELGATAGVGPKAVWFSIDSHEGELRAGDAGAASAIGTNLKRLSDGQLSVLTRHGGGLLASRLDRYASELLV